MPEEQTFTARTWADAVVTKAEPRDAEEAQAAPEEDQEDQEEQS